MGYLSPSDTDVTAKVIAVWGATKGEGVKIEDFLRWEGVTKKTSSVYSRGILVVGINFEGVCETIKNTLVTPVSDRRL